jgi:hypothetical protein
VRRSVEDIVMKCPNPTEQPDTSITTLARAGTGPAFAVAAIRLSLVAG